MNPGHRRRPRLQNGFSMIEILVTLVITAFGLLGLAGFVTKATTLSVDATQRARAATLLSDMAGRLTNNKANAADYASAAVYGAAEDVNCAGTAVQRDLCEWNNLLFGTNDAGSGNAAFLGFRGCVTRPDALQPVFVVTVAWGSLTPGPAPTDGCAAGEFGDDTLRRVIRYQVRIADLG